MKRKGIAIARRESHLYLRSPMVWMGALVIGAVTMALVQAQSPVPLDLLLTRGEYLVVPVTLLIAALVFTAGLAREEREWFDDLWNTLPVRNATQYWGKLLGTVPVAAALIASCLLIIPIAWFLYGIDWTKSANQAILLYVAQGAAVILLAVGLSALLRSLIPSFRMRGVVGVGLVVLLVLSPRLIGVPWGVLIAPYVVGGVPLGFSALFGPSPWERAVLWHLLFQVALAISLMAAAALIYKRRRDPGTLPGPRALLLLVSLSVSLASAQQYHAFWKQVYAATSTETNYDIAAQTAATGHAAPAVLAYDIAVQWTGESTLHIRTRIHLMPQKGQRRMPFTLHHQWEVTQVEGAGLISWERDGNLLWFTVEEGLDTVLLTVDYFGEPFVWEYAAYIAVPAHFMLQAGGYLSPHMAWYPLPGARVLHDSSVPIADEARTEGEPGLGGPVTFRLAWHGPEELGVITSLPHVPDLTADGVRHYAGRSDGVALFTARLEQARLDSYSILGAPSLIRDAEPLLSLYRTMVDFYSDLLGRPLAMNGSILVVPSWLDRAYGTYRRRTSERAEAGWALAMPILGDRLVLTEHHAAFIVDRAATWLRSNDPNTLMEASKHLHDALQHSLWAGVDSHLPFTRSPVAVGVAEFARLQWVRRVLGEEVYQDALADVAARMGQPRASSLRRTDEVLQRLVELDASKGEAAVRKVLGWAYDRLHEGGLDLGAFVQYVQDLP